MTRHAFGLIQLLASGGLRSGVDAISEGLQLLGVSGEYEGSQEGGGAYSASESAANDTQAQAIHVHDESSKISVVVGAGQSGPLSEQMMCSMATKTNTQ